MMGRKLCLNCPFKAGSRYGYDSDALEALRAGAVPACHMVVGLDDIFRYSCPEPPEDKNCIGYRLWAEGRRGFRKPKLVR